MISFTEEMTQIKGLTRLPVTLLSRVDCNHFSFYPSAILFLSFESTNMYIDGPSDIITSNRNTVQTL